jgi:hypothetical protein
VLTCLLAFHSFGVLVENGRYASFERLKSVNSSAWDLVQDTVQASKIIDGTIHRCRENLQLRHNPPLRDEEHWDSISEGLQHLPVRNQREAMLAESEYISRAVNYALNGDPDIFKFRGKSTVPSMINRLTPRCAIRQAAQLFCLLPIHLP